MFARNTRNGNMRMFAQLRSQLLLNSPCFSPHFEEIVDRNLSGRVNTERFQIQHQANIRTYKIHVWVLSDLVFSWNALASSIECMIKENISPGYFICAVFVMGI